MADDTLRTALVDLVRAASSHGITIFLGGGYGLYLKQIHLTSTQQRTFLPVEAWPRPRGTPDLDIFLPTEIVVDLKHMTRFREILDGLGYKPVPTARFMHFEKQVSQGRVRVELLTGPIASELLDKVRLQKRPRVRPKGEVELHAYLHEEAVALDVEPLSLPVGEVMVLVPNAFSFLVMKLHACHDRLDDEDKQLGRHHALDVYRLLAMLSEPEVELVRKLRRVHRENPAVTRAAEIATDVFGHITSRGALRMREHALANADLQIERALDLLHDLFQEAGS